MSKIQDLIDLKLMYPDGESIYDLEEIGGYTDSYEQQMFTLERNGVTVIKKEERDQDPELYYQGNIESVTVEFNGTLFKSHCYSGSYGVPTWSEWREVEPVIKTEYHYVESPY